MDGIGARLREAIELWPGGGIRPFQKALEALNPRPRGSSYAMIHRYMKGEGRPPRDFIRAAAKVLGVREAWLLNGPPEEMTDAGRQVNAELGDSSPAGPTVFDAMVEGFPPLKILPSHIQHLFVAVIIAVVVRSRGEWPSGSMDRGPQFDALVKDAAGWIGNHIMEPWPDHRSAAEVEVFLAQSHTFNTYAVAALHALSLANLTGETFRQSEAQRGRWKKPSWQEELADKLTEAHFRDRDAGEGTI